MKVLLNKVRTNRTRERKGLFNFIIFSNYCFFPINIKKFWLFEEKVRKLALFLLVISIIC